MLHTRYAIGLVCLVVMLITAASAGAQTLWILG